MQQTDADETARANDRREIPTGGTAAQAQDPGLDYALALSGQYPVITPCSGD